MASLISACDLIVSTTNATVHLSASLGKDTRVLLPINPDARWGIKGKKVIGINQFSYIDKSILRLNEPLNELNNDLKEML